MVLRCSPNKDAFSLLELIVTIAVLSIGVIAVLQALSFSIRVTGLSSDIVKAVFLTQDKIQELEFKEKLGLIGKEQPLEPPGSDERFQWNYNLSPDADLNLYKLKFDISWQRANRNEEIELSTYLR